LEVIHLNLTKQDSSTILEQVCRDRARLFANGWISTSFHYPDGKFNVLSNIIVNDCGYNSALVEVANVTSFANAQNLKNLPFYNALNTVSFDDLVNQVLLSNGITIFNFHEISVDNDSPLFRFFEWLNANGISIKSVDQIVSLPVKPVPEEFRNTEPTPTPDPEAQLKFYVGIGCIGALVLLVLYVVITTRIKRQYKIKFPC
jgi:hypothetical protein